MGKIQRIDQTVKPQFASNVMHNTVGGSLHKCILSETNPPYCSGERCSSQVQQTEVGGDILTKWSQCVWHHFFTGRSFFHFCICCASTLLHAHTESSSGSPAVFSHRLPLDIYRLYTWRPGREILLKLQSVSLVYLHVHVRLLRTSLPNQCMH